MTRIFALAAVAAAFVLQAAPAAAADFKDFREWHAACDNLRNCSAYGFESAVTGSTYLRIERGGAPNAPVKITLAVFAEDDVTFTLRFNDASLPGLPDNALTGTKNEDDSLRRIVLTDTVSADTLIASFRKAETIVITRTDPPGKKEPSDPLASEISMSGAVASLLWIDEQQKRFGTATALIRKGDKPASTIPPQPKAAVIVAARPAIGTPPAATAPALIKKGRALCGEEDEGSTLTETWPLGNNQFLYAFSCPDQSGAYNYSYGLLVATGGNPATARPVKVDWPIKIGDLEKDPGLDAIATNPMFDPKTMVLSTFGKGRGLGDCGNWEEWVWDGKTFRLAILRAMPHCKGIPIKDWPTLYRAERK
ncbi:MAG TPA: DUF1176 domain-containing protein [Pseudorhodoplanes sp.]|nr:DUF1176 domain-containing protein [Pseudorhodoplanes sp.]